MNFLRLPSLVRMLSIGLVLFSLSSFADTLHVPGGLVGEQWGVDLNGLVEGVQSYELKSGPEWSTLSPEGVLSGTPLEEKEETWEISAKKEDGSEDLTVSAYFFK